MTSTRILIILLLAVGYGSLGNAEPMGTAWTYQGRLMDTNGPADGLYDLKFTLFTDPVLSSSQVGSPVEVNDIDIIDGYFTVELDFGNTEFKGDARWLEISVRPWDSDERHTPLSPRQEVTATPYALYAQNADTDNDWMVSGNDMYSIPSGKIGIGTAAPISSLEVISPSTTHAIRATTDYIPVYALRTSTTGTWPAVAADCNSQAAGASAVRGRILSTTPGSLSAGVYGYNYGEGSNGVGVRGYHAGTGSGVYGQCDNGKGVYGVSSNGYAGFFSGEKSYFQGRVGIGTMNPSVKLDVVAWDANAAISATNNDLDRENSAIYGYSYRGYGVFGKSIDHHGVYGDSSIGAGVWGKSINYNGVHGESREGHGVSGYSHNGNGISGSSGWGYAGYFTGDVYVTLNCSAESFTDRTPYPPDLATAYRAVMSMQRLPDGQYDENNREAQLDHSMLTDFVRSEDGNRDLSATVSCHNEVLKDLIRKQQQLIVAHIYIEQLQKQNRVLEERLDKLEAIITQPTGR